MHRESEELYANIAAHMSLNADHLQLACCAQQCSSAPAPCSPLPPAHNEAQRHDQHPVLLQPGALVRLRLALAAALLAFRVALPRSLLARPTPPPPPTPQNNPKPATKKKTKSNYKAH